VLVCVSYGFLYLAGQDFDRTSVLTKIKGKQRNKKNICFIAIIIYYLYNILAFCPVMSKSTFLY